MIASDLAEIERDSEGFAAARRAAPADSVKEHFGHVVLIERLGGSRTSGLTNDHLTRGLTCAPEQQFSNRNGRGHVQLLLKADAAEIDLAGARTSTERNARRVTRTVTKAKDFDPAGGISLLGLSSNASDAQENFYLPFLFLFLSCFW